jgi:hypothetical protein
MLMYGVWDVLLCNGQQVQAEQVLADWGHIACEAASKPSHAW